MCGACDACVRACAVVGWAVGGGEKKEETRFFEGRQFCQHFGRGKKQTRRIYIQNTPTIGNAKHRQTDTEHASHSDLEWISDTRADGVTLLFFKREKQK